VTAEVRLEVHVTPRAAADEVRVIGGTVRVRVTAPPADGQANAAVLRLLARALRVPARDIRLVGGATARRKVVAIADLDPAGLSSRLTAVGRQPEARAEL